MNYVESKSFQNEISISLDETEFIECSFEGLNLSEENLKNSKFIECHFNKCNGSNLKVVNTTFRETKFNECKLVGINWSAGQSISNLEMNESILDYGVFQDLNLSNCKFIKCCIKEVDFSQSKMMGCQFTGSILRGSTFTGCDLSKADLRDAIEYNIDPEFTKLKKAKFSMPEAISLLNSLEIIIE